jgi:hypothetical protein
MDDSQEAPGEVSFSVSCWNVCDHATSGVLSSGPHGAFSLLAYSAGWSTRNLPPRPDTIRESEMRAGGEQNLRQVGWTFSPPHLPAPRHSLRFVSQQSARSLDKQRKYQRKCHEHAARCLLRRACAIWSLGATELLSQVRSHKQKARKRSTRSPVQSPMRETSVR